MRQEEETGGCEPDGKMAGGLNTSAVSFGFWYKPQEIRYGVGDAFVPFAHLDMISPNCFVIITSVNHAPPFAHLPSPTIRTRTAVLARIPATSVGSPAKCFTNRGLGFRAKLLFLQSPSPPLCVHTCRLFSPGEVRSDLTLNSLIRTGSLTKFRFLSGVNGNHPTQTSATPAMLLSNGI